MTEGFEASEVRDLTNEHWLKEKFGQLWMNGGWKILSEYDIFTNENGRGYPAKGLREGKGMIVPLGDCPSDLNEEMKWYILFFSRLNRSEDHMCLSSPFYLEELCFSFKNQTVLYLCMSSLYKFSFRKCHIAKIEHEAALKSTNLNDDPLNYLLIGYNIKGGPCLGDSGGPAFTRTSSGQYVLLGTVIVYIINSYIIHFS